MSIERIAKPAKPPCRRKARGGGSTGASRAPAPNDFWRRGGVAAWRSLSRLPARHARRCVQEGHNRPVSLRLLLAHPADYHRAAHPGRQGRICEEDVSYEAFTWIG